MINEDLKIEKRETADYVPIPEDMYQIEVLDVNNEKTETYDSKMGNTDKKEYEQILNLQYVVLDEGEHRGRSVWDNFVPTYLYISKKNGKNKLYQILESLLGRELTQQEEAEGINSETINGLIGKQMRVATKNVVKGDKTYTKIETYYKSKGDVTPLTEEEKEKATPKPKDTTITPEEAVEDDGIALEDIPF